MNHAEIVSHLSSLIDSPTTDVLYKITMKQVIQQIAYRMGDDALSLTHADLELAREKVKEAISLNLYIRTT